MAPGGKPRNTFWAGILRDDEEVFSFYVRPVYLLVPGVVILLAVGSFATCLWGAPRTGSLAATLVVLCLFVAVFAYLMRALRFDTALRSGTITHYIGSWRGWEQRASFSLVGVRGTIVEIISDEEKTVYDFVFEFTTGDRRVLCTSDQQGALTDAALILQAKFNLKYNGTHQPTKYSRKLIEYVLQQPGFAFVAGVEVGQAGPEPYSALAADGARSVVAEIPEWNPDLLVTEYDTPSDFDPQKIERDPVAHLLFREQSVYCVECRDQLLYVENASGPLFVWVVIIAAVTIVGEIIAYQWSQALGAFAYVPLVLGILGIAGAIAKRLSKQESGRERSAREVFDLMKTLKIFAQVDKIYILADRAAQQIRVYRSDSFGGMFLKQVIDMSHAVAIVCHTDISTERTLLGGQRTYRFPPEIYIAMEGGLENKLPVFVYPKYARYEERLADFFGLPVDDVPQRFDIHEFIRTTYSVPGGKPEPLRETSRRKPPPRRRIGG